VLVRLLQHRIAGPEPCPYLEGISSTTETMLMTGVSPAELDDLLVRGYDRAERVAAAMRCRGFDGRFRSLDEFSTKGRDVVAFVLTLALAAALVTLDVLLRE